MNAWWSWLLTAWGITGLILAGRRRAVGWAVGLSAQALWLAYALTTHQWGFIASAFAYGIVYARNWRAWRRTPNWRHAVQKEICVCGHRRDQHDDGASTLCLSPPQVSAGWLVNGEGDKHIYCECPKFTLPNVRPRR